MCGITGQFNLDKSKPVQASHLKNSLNQLKKRGPDSQDTWIAPGMGLGHARLSIIDLNMTANQPMHDPTGRYTIVFNGEIFNYKELRQQLPGPFHTRSDTEVLLQAYLQWKERCLEKLNGFFAFVIYDRERHQLFAARDRYGMKPFLFAFQESSFFFASELKALLQYPVRRNLSHEAMNAFFHLSYIPGKQAILEDVQRLLPGHYLEVKNQKLSIHQYYHLENLESKAPPSFEEAKEKLRSLVDSAADYWIESDAPLGAFLSGGIDSSIVVAITSQKIQNLKTYSVTFPDSQFHNEGPFARAVADRYQTNHTEIPLTTENIYSSIDDVLDSLDEPFADSSAIPSYALCRQVGKHVKVALSGDGADEVFGGYEKYRAELIARKWQYLALPARMIYPLTKNLPESRDQALTNQFRKLNRFLKGIHLSEQERYLQWCYFTQPERVEALLTHQHQTSQWKSQLPFYNKISYSGLNRIFYRDSKMVLPNDMLTKVDMMSMANSLEVRPLLLDHRIVDFAFSLPDSYKVNSKRKKHLLLETFKHLLPEQVYNRPKHGFTIELMPFFRKQFWEKLNDVYLNDQLIREQGLFRLQQISKLKAQIKDEKASDIQPLVWSLITFQNFWLKYNPKVP